MKQHKFLIIVCAFLFWSCPGWSIAAADGDSILAAAESTFKAMKDGNYAGIWSLLSEKSRSLIADDVLSAVNKKGARYDKNAVMSDFAGGGPLAASYWRGYMESFDPVLVLEESTWEMGKIEKGKAEILIRYKKAEKPAVLKMFQENGRWKTGLEETFRSSRK